MCTHSQCFSKNTKNIKIFPQFLQLKNLSILHYKASFSIAFQSLVITWILLIRRQRLGFKMVILLKFLYRVVPL